MGTLSLVALDFYRRGGSRWLAALSLLLLTFGFLNYEFMPFIFTDPIYCLPLSGSIDPETLGGCGLRCS